MENEHNDKLNHHQSRIDRLEGVVEGLATNQAKTETQLASLVTSVDRISTNFESFSVRANDNSKTNWGVLISTGSLVFTVIVALGAGFVGVPLNNLTSDVYKLTEKNRDSHNEFRMEIRTIREDMGIHNANDMAVHGYIDKTLDEFKQEQKLFRANQVEDAIGHTSYDERIQNLERQMFSDVKYRNGRPDGSTK